MNGLIMKKRFYFLLPLLIILSIIPIRMWWLPKLGKLNYILITSLDPWIYIFIASIVFIFILGLVYFGYMYKLSIRKRKRLNILQKITLIVAFTIFIELFINALLSLLSDTYVLLFLMGFYLYPPLGATTPITFGLTWYLLYLWFKKSDKLINVN